MSTKSNRLTILWSDQDDAPELSAEWFETAPLAGQKHQ